MKKIIVLLITLLSSFAIFAKEKPLQVTETEWGLEISNLDAKGRKICKDYLQFQGSTSVFVILKNNNNNFDINLLAEALWNTKSVGPLFYSQIHFIPTSTLDTTLFYDGKSFSNISTNESLSKYDSILIIPTDCEITSYKAFCENNDFYFEILDTKENSKFTELLESKRKEVNEKKRIETATLEIKNMIENSRKTDLFAYSLATDGNIGIAAYIGEPTDNLIIPEKIDGIPVTHIWNIKNITNTEFKMVTIPKTVEDISSSAFENCGIETLVFASGSVCNVIGRYAFARNKIKNYNIPSTINFIGAFAFAYNEIEELTLPQKDIIIAKCAFNANKIKKLNICKDWRYYFDDVEFEELEKDYNYRYGRRYRDTLGFIRNSEFLEEIYFEDGCNHIGIRAFSDCINLKKISLPSTMERVYGEAFENCSSLSEVILRGNVKFEHYNLGSWKFGREGNYTFDDCPLSLQTRSQLLKAGIDPMSGLIR